ncbi:MAG: transketolase [Chitinivibrionales bacterium]|nr:transketolase [Chitinivibrionales bacterium]
MSEAIAHLETIARRVRSLILRSSGQAGSGHPSSALSATDLMVGLLFGGVFRYFPDRPEHPNNDRLIFSKGHASPLYYGLWAAAGKLSDDDMMRYRTFGSPLEGHPSMAFRFVEAATGSLGQGLSVGVGMALSAKRFENLPFRTYVLLGDSEMAEGSQWEALQLAAYYALDNLVGIIDVNRLGQRGETMFGYDTEAYRRRVEAFGWQTITIDGHDFGQILDAYSRALSPTGVPTMIIARTVKGKGVSFLEDKNGWHGKAVKGEKLEQALAGLGSVDTNAQGTITPPEDLQPAPVQPSGIETIDYTQGDAVATRDAFGKALRRIFPAYPSIVCLDGEVSNSTRSEYFQETYPGRFLQMFIAEQNMVGAALSLSRRGQLPFVATFAAFLTRAFDQIRMARYSEANIKFVGSHAGVSIGRDGPSQMGLEDLAMFRSVLDSVVLYPCDAVSTDKLVEAMIGHRGISYLRTTRGTTPVIYEPGDEFTIGGSAVLRKDIADAVAVVAAGITVHEALRAHEELRQEGIAIRVIDLYSVKPIDSATLRQAADNTRAIITVEDHYAEGGLGEAVAAELADHATPVYCLAVRKKPVSGSTQELLDYEQISSASIVAQVKQLLQDSGL